MSHQAEYLSLRITEKQRDSIFIVRTTGHKNRSSRDDPLNRGRSRLDRRNRRLQSLRRSQRRPTLLGHSERPRLLQPRRDTAFRCHPAHPVVSSSFQIRYRGRSLTSSSHRPIEIGLAMKPEEFRKLALRLPEALEHQHQGHPDFRVHGKVFATLGWPDTGWGVAPKRPVAGRNKRHHHIR